MSPTAWRRSATEKSTWPRPVFGSAQTGFRWADVGLVWAEHGQVHCLEQAGTRSWAAEGHLLIVDVDDDRMIVHPVTDVAVDGSFTYLHATTPDGRAAAMPIVVPRRASPTDTPPRSASTEER